MTSTCGKYILGFASLAVIGSVIFLGRRDSGAPPQQNGLIPEQTISHGHGLAVDIVNPNKVFIATHYGLLLLENDTDLYRVGTSKNDYMGFSAHPTDQNVFFTSGHPPYGGNLGFQKSEDGGATWKKVSDGVNGPVDFHLMAVSPANPNLIYGWHSGTLQRSSDGGLAWSIVETENLAQSIHFAPDPKNENKLYAVTIYGVALSNDQGETWQDVFPKLYLNLVTAFAVRPDNPQEMIAYSKNLGMLVSNDGGATWEESSHSFSNDAPLFISYAPSEPTIAYALTQANALHKSVDAGKTWTQIR